MSDATSQGLMPGAPAQKGNLFIGGVGGSGTRLVAQVLEGLGIAMGPCLNAAFDNLWFTCLFKRPDWVRRQRAALHSEIPLALDLFAQAMGEGLAQNISPVQERLLAEAEKNIRSGLAGSGARLDALASLHKAPGCKGRRWACKEPNSHVFLEEIATTLNDVRYLHVVRHGLDMAFSRNTQQAHAWSGEYNMASVDIDGAPNPRDVFNYWGKANERALQLGQALLGRRFMIVTLENLCRNPQDEINNIARWADLPSTPDLVSKLARLPALPASTGRYRDNDLWQLSEADHSILELFGYSVKSAR